MNRRIGILAMLGAVAIYGANFAISRHALLNGLTPNDLVAMRYGVAGVLLLPVFISRGVADCAGIGWGRGVLLAIMSGVPMALLMNTGLALAPASHGAAIGPGTVTVMGVAGGALLFGTRPSRAVLIGIAVVLAGLASIGIAGSRTGGPSTIYGDLFFLGTGLLWGLYPLLLQKWSVGAMTSTAIVSVLSLAFIPIYVGFLDPRILTVDPWIAILHAINQGVLSVILGLWLWGLGVRVLGATEAQRFPPLIPVVGTLLGIPILGEWPAPLQALGVALIVGGLGLASFGDRLFRPKAPGKEPGPGS
jgi:drug/metabolite transporter (DMT)-like permease